VAALADDLKEEPMKHPFGGEDPFIRCIGIAVIDEKRVSFVCLKVFIAHCLG